MVRNLRRSPLDTNLTKWLSKCEGSLHKSKRKRQLKGEYDADSCGIKEHRKESKIRITKWKNETKQEHNTRVKWNHATWSVVGLQDKCC